MPNVLNHILDDTRKAVEERKKHVSEAELDGQSYQFARKDVFFNALMRSEVPAVIAEIKQKSPSHGEFKDILTVEERATMYEEAGANGISYITNKTFFGGVPSIVKNIKKASLLPVLQKDFIVDEFQIMEAAGYGADALLLIARLVDMETLRRYVVKCQQYNIEPVVEVYDEGDLLNALETTARVIGVNSRNLDTLEMDMENACTIMKKIPEEKVIIGFSGISSKNDAMKYINAGARGVLIGGSFMKVNSVNEFIQSLR